MDKRALPWSRYAWQIREREELFLLLTISLSIFQIGSESSKRSAEAEKEDIYQLGVILLQVLTGKLVKSTREVDELKLEVFLFTYSPLISLIKRFQGAIYSLVFVWSLTYS